MKKYICIGFLIFVVLIMQSAYIDSEPKNKAELGKLLFFDKVLSRDRSISCASCHQEQFAFSDTSVVSTGVAGRKGKRNSPSAMNMKLQSHFFWDGRAATLEEQAVIPIENPDEMDLPVDSAVARLKSMPFYRASFQKLFGGEPDKSNLAIALSEFEKTLETNDSPLDDWRLNDNQEAVSESAKRGFKLFNGKGNCVQCHFGADFRNAEFRNIGLFDGKTLADSGRAAITKNPADLGKFNIGSLRNVSLTAPYMHNGMFKTLRQVIDYYNDPDKIVANSINRDPLLSKPLNLTEQEKTDLESFLLSLTDRRFSQSLTMKKSRKDVN